MKNKMIVLLAGALLTAGMASNASASFATGDLIRVVYVTGGAEIATDLGAVTTLESDVNTVVGGGSDAFTANGITSSSFANADVAYFAVTGKNLYVTGSAATVASGPSYAGVEGAITTVLTTYNTNAGITSTSGNTSVGITGSGQSYYTVLDKSGSSIGSVAAMVLPTEGTEASLATLSTATPVSQQVYGFIGVKNSPADVFALNVQTNADGSTTINAAQPVSTTPIPPSFFLMGSGLLGMVGLRRKKA